jgi:hypothetical protein
MREMRFERTTGWIAVPKRHFEKLRRRPEGVIEGVSSPSRKQLSDRTGNDKSLPVPGMGSRDRPCVQRDFSGAYFAEPEAAHNSHTTAAEVRINRGFEELTLRGKSVEWAFGPGSCQQNRPLGAAESLRGPFPL